MPTSTKFKHLEAVVFDPSWRIKDYPTHPLKRGDVVYMLGEIPNKGGHCVVAVPHDKIVTDVHLADFRKATEDEV